MNRKLAIITTHPIQYNAPWFRLLAERGNIAVKVFYTWSQVEKEEKFDPGFGKNVKWDIPLLEGYDYTFVENISKTPGSKSFKGIDNPTLIKEVEEWGADVILVFGWKFKSHLNALKKFHNKIPVLFRGDSNLLGRKSGIGSFLRKVVLKNVFKKIDYALYVGKENKKYFQYGRLRETQLFYVPHAIDNDRFQKTEESVRQGDEFRKQANVKKGDLVFLFAGKFEPVKNPLLLLSVAKEIETKGVHFVFAGNGPLQKEMKKSQYSNVHFLDFQNQGTMPGLYQMCDVYVLTSFSETWGLAVNEAMAAGKPVLISNTCGCGSDLIDEGKTGFTFMSDNANDLKTRIRFMIDHRDELRNMGENAFRKIKDYSFERNCVILEQLVNRIS